MKFSMNANIKKTQVFFTEKGLKLSQIHFLFKSDLIKFLFEL